MTQELKLQISSQSQLVLFVDLVWIFLDIFKRPNAYVELNPSMYISEEGECKILIRAVNYRKFINKYFTLYGYPSNSIYFLLTGKVDKKLDTKNKDLLFWAICLS